MNVDISCEGDCFILLLTDLRSSKESRVDGILGGGLLILAADLSVFSWSAEVIPVTWRSSTFCYLNIWRLNDTWTKMCCPTYDNIAITVFRQVHQFAAFCQYTLASTAGKGAIHMYTWMKILQKLGARWKCTYISKAENNVYIVFIHFLHFQLWFDSFDQPKACNILLAKLLSPYI